MRPSKDQPGLFPEEKIKNKAADQPWMKSERDKMLDNHFHGMHPDRNAQELGRNPKAVKRRLEQYTYNERDFAVRYEPFRRLSRRGKRMSQNDTAVLTEHRKRGVPVKVTARLLARGVSELTGGPAQKIASMKELKVLAPTIDLIWAHRYLFFVYKKPIITDEVYNGLVEEEIEYGGGGPAFAELKAMDEWPSHIRQLALYLADKHFGWPHKA